MWVRLPAHTPPVESRGPRSYMAAAKKAPRKLPTKATRSRRPAAARGPEPRESVIDPTGDEVSNLVAQVQRHGGAVVGAYRDPFAGQMLVLASLPLKKVAATPFQRDLSKTHATRLADAIGAAGLFLDPVIAVPSRDGFWSPNGRHRLEAARRLGMRSVTAQQPRSKETEHAVTFDSPVFLTLGNAYEQRSRFAGSSYQSVLNKVDRFLDSTLPAALRQREQWAVRIMDIDDRVAAHVKTMQTMGMKSPYLRAVVVARINPVRFVPPSRKKDAAPPMSMAEALTKMAANVRKFDPKSVRPGDLALVAAIAPSES